MPSRLLGLALTTPALIFGIAAALGTITGLFLGIPTAGFVLSPVIRVGCDRPGLEAEAGRGLELEASLCAGLGMGLGVGLTVALVGIIAVEPSTPLAATASGGVGGLTFGSAWRFGYRQRSAAPVLLLTALLAGATAAGAVG